MCFITNATANSKPLKDQVKSASFLVNYYQEADNVLPHLYSSTTFTKSMTTWASWIEKHMNPRSSAPSHFKGGESNDGGHCKEATQSPNQTTTTNNSSVTNLILQCIIKQMKTPVNILNITTLSDYRIDGHPSALPMQW
ncbi:hypothetical protein CTI12_AA435790 [Artemisia annua]|uniref:Trichome birefringence-like C-terminal domain-containing protein n=1 Tax=Artemisia annua TaxID=35608 RepID=A0A2U1LZ62_ARTAN|nr:hypothetical protein CTI12_AA435790 [Artemisia annua]